MEIIVSKFGGTSMENAAAMTRSAGVVLKQGAQVVVVSATSGTTNDLIELGKCSENSNQDKADQILKKLVQKHTEIAQEFGLSEQRKTQLQLYFDEMRSLHQGIHLLKDCSPKAFDALMSLGEKMSSLLFTQCLSNLAKKSDVVTIDAREIITTDDQFGSARPNISEIFENCQSKLRPLLNQGAWIVTQGFIGKSPKGATTTLGRGGSDYSAALFAEGLAARTLEIWTDVPGIATTDPRITNRATIIPELSFNEASEMASFGAKILHPATLTPAMRKNIPVFVASSFEPEKGGTWIRRTSESHPLIRAFAIKRNQTLVTISNPEMLYAHGFLHKIFEIFNDHKISIDTISTSLISVAFTLDDSRLLTPQVLESLSRFAQVETEENLALVSIIGNQINYTAGLAERVFHTLSDVNVRMIGMGASKHHFCFLVGNDRGHEAIQRLHDAFISGEAKASPEGH